VDAFATSILKQPDVVMKPLLTRAEGKRMTNWDRLKSKGDPLAVTSMLFGRLREAQHSPKAKKDAATGLEMFLNHWPTVTRGRRSVGSLS